MSSMFTLLIAGSSFFSNTSATTEIYTLSLHDALPISRETEALGERVIELRQPPFFDFLEIDRELSRLASQVLRRIVDRKSTRLNSSHSQISYAVFCLKKKTKNNNKTVAPSNKNLHKYI